MNDARVLITTDVSYIGTFPVWLVSGAETHDEIAPLGALAANSSAGLDGCELFWDYPS